MKQTVAPVIPALSELDRPALAALLGDIDVASYRTDQIFDAAWRSTAASWSEVTTLGKPLQAALESRLRYEAFSEIVREDADAEALGFQQATDQCHAEARAVHLRRLRDELGVELAPVGEGGKHFRQQAHLDAARGAQLALEALQRLQR